MSKDGRAPCGPRPAQGVAGEGCPPIERLFEQYAEAGGELLVGPLGIT